MIGESGSVLHFNTLPLLPHQSPSAVGRTDVVTTKRLYPILNPMFPLQTLLGYNRDKENRFVRMVRHR